MTNKDDVKKLIRDNERRLQKLKEKEAKFGVDTPPHILIEIEDIQEKIEELRLELANLEIPDRPSYPPIITPSEISQDSSSSNNPLSGKDILANINLITSSQLSSQSPVTSVSSQSTPMPVMPLPLPVSSGKALVAPVSVKSETIERRVKGRMTCLGFGLGAIVLVGFFVLSTIIGGILAYSEWPTQIPATKIIEEVITPTKSSAYYNKGLDYVASKDFEKAIDEFKKAIELDPNYAEAYYQLGVIYGNSDDLQQAFSLLNKAIEIKPDLADAYYSRALVHGKTDDFDQAITDFNKAIELDPNYELAYFYRGVAYRELGNFKKALLDFDKVIELNPNSVQGYFDRGVTHFNMGATEKALPDFDKAIELEPTNVLAYKNRGFTQIKVGNLEQALSDLEQYLKLSSSTSSDREEVLRTVAQLKSELGK